MLEMSCPGRAVQSGTTPVLTIYFVEKIIVSRLALSHMHDAADQPRHRTLQSSGFRLLNLVDMHPIQI